MTHAEQARYRAIKYLQDCLRQLPPGSIKADQVEHALDLALSDTRALPDAYLVRQLLRNSRYILSRQSHRNPQSLDVVLAECHEPPRAIIGSVTPEKSALALEMRNALVAMVAPSRPHAAKVLEGLLLGETAKETATRLSISPDQVDRTRKALQLAAHQFLEGRHAI